MYEPQNNEMFTAAFSGALAGMGASNRVPTNPNVSNYSGLAELAGAFAQSFDIVWGGQANTTLDVELTRQLCEVVWQDRAPSPFSQLLNPDTYTPECEALYAMILAARAYYADEDIIPPPAAGPIITVRVVDADYTVKGSDYLIVADTSLVTINLPDDAAVGDSYEVKNMSNGDIVVSSDPLSIDGVSATEVLGALDNRVYTFVVLTDATRLWIRR